MTDKNLFLYNLAVVAIFKDEGEYLKEWLDYHLLAGVDHFYLYNNDSSDDYEKILAPYVENNSVTLTNISGRGMQTIAYDDATEKFRFECRYMAFIDLDEFIFPKTAQSVVEVADEIFSRYDNAAGLAINWQCFGSSGQETADYSRGVLERFTRRAKSDWIIFREEDSNLGNIFIKTLANPRCIDFFFSPHYPFYFKDLNSINSDGAQTHFAGNRSVTSDKIVLNHYYTKSREEFEKKKSLRGKSYSVNKKYLMEDFYTHDRNEIFDDGILKYRAARAENFSLESHEERLRRTEKSLIKILTQCSPLEAPAEFFVGKLETFLTCRALAEKLGTKIGTRAAEEYALAWLYQTLIKGEKITHAEIQQFIRALPEILVRPFPLCKKIKNLTQELVIPSFCEAFKNIFDFKARFELIQFQKLLRLIN